LYTAKNKFGGQLTSSMTAFEKTEGWLRVASTHPTAARIDIRSRAGANGKRATLSGLTNGDP
jgi:hypothetical protein